MCSRQRTADAGALAAWLGVSPGRTAVLPVRNVGVTVSWPLTSPNGPTLGSIRPALERASFVLGDQALLHFHRKDSTLHLRKVDPGTVGNVSILRRVSLPTGIPGERPADVPGVAGPSHWDDRLLRVHPGGAQPREADLVALVPDEAASEELDEVIEESNKV